MVVCAEMKEDGVCRSFVAGRFCEVSCCCYELSLAVPCWNDCNRLCVSRCVTMFVCMMCSSTSNTFDDMLVRDIGL